MKKNVFKISTLTLLFNTYINYQNASVNLASSYVDCGGVSFPKGVINLSHAAYLLIQIAVPVLLIILGMLDYGKAAMAKDQKEVAKKQKVFIKRFIAAGIVFLVSSVASLVVSMVSTSTNFTSCVACITKGESYCNGDVSSPIIPDYPGSNGSNNDGNFKQPGLVKDNYEYDPDDDDYGSSSNDNNNNNNNNNSNSNADLSTIGTGENPNETAAPVGTTVSEPQGREVPALFTAYYPANNSLQGGFNDCKGYPLQPNKQTAAAPKSVPYGSIMYIKSIDGSGYQNYVGRPYVVTDRGGAIKIENGVYHFDLLHPDHESAYAFGKRTGRAIIVER